MTSEATYVEPSTIAEAEARRDALLNKIKDIDAQLGDKCKLNPDGTAMSSADFWHWRSRAVWARRHLDSEAAFLKRWVKTKRQEIEAATNGVATWETDEQLLAAARVVIKDLASERGGLRSDHDAVVRAIENRLGLR